MEVKLILAESSSPDEIQTKFNNLIHYMKEEQNQVEKTNHSSITIEQIAAFQSMQMNGSSPTNLSKTIEGLKRGPKSSGPAPRSGRFLFDSFYKNARLAKMTWEEVKTNYPNLVSQFELQERDFQYEKPLSSNCLYHLMK